MRLKLTIQYKGTHYFGWQMQPQGPTIQGVLEKAFAQIFGKRVVVMGSGRTDSGVHALGQVAHVDVGDEPFGDRLIYALNSILPHDIRLIDIQPVSDKFHAQKSVKRKIYDYYVFNGNVVSPFLNEMVWMVVPKLNLTAMRKAAKILIGEHDFAAFCASDATVKTTVRKVYRLVIGRGEPMCSPRADTQVRLYKFTFEGAGFLKYMVRNIVGTLVDVGKGKKSVQEVKAILKSRDRKQAGRTAPAFGLFLRKVMY